MADHRLFAAFYERLSPMMERSGIGERRRRLLVHARGSVLDVGAGLGQNLPHLRHVDGVVALEPDASMRRALERNAAAAECPVEVHDGTIEHSGLADQSYDTVVATLVLCTVDHLDRALSEIRRVLRPNGRFLFLEHVARPDWRGRVQRMVDPLWCRVAAGCHLTRDTPDAIRQAGFLVTEMERFTLAPAPFSAIMPAVQGIARPRATEVAA